MSITSQVVIHQQQIGAEKCRPIRMHYQVITATKELPAGCSRTLRNEVSQDGVQYTVDHMHASRSGDEAIPLHALLEYLGFSQGQVDFVKAVTAGNTEKELKLFFPFGLRKVHSVQYVRLTGDYAVHDRSWEHSIPVGTIDYTSYPFGLTIQTVGGTDPVLMISMDTSCAVWSQFKLRGRHGSSSGLFCTADQMEDFFALLGVQHVARVKKETAE